MKDFFIVIVTLIMLFLNSKIKTKSSFFLLNNVLFTSNSFSKLRKLIFYYLNTENIVNTVRDTKTPSASH